MSTEDPLRPLVLGPEQGRLCRMGGIEAVFKADGAETGGRSSVSEWWLDPRREGPGAHRHDADEGIFHVIEAEASILLGEVWHRLGKGAMSDPARHDSRFPGWSATYVVSSIAADAGYLVVVPLAAAAFHSRGRHPHAGLAAAFSGVAAGVHPALHAARRRPEPGARRRGAAADRLAVVRPAARAGLISTRLRGETCPISTAFSAPSIPASTPRSTGSSSPCA